MHFSISPFLYAEIARIELCHRVRRLPTVRHPPTHSDLFVRGRESDPVNLNEAQRIFEKLKFSWRAASCRLIDVIQGSEHIGCLKNTHAGNNGLRFQHTQSVGHCAIPCDLFAFLPLSPSLSLSLSLSRSQESVSQQHREFKSKPIAGVERLMSVRPRSWDSEMIAIFQSEPIGTSQIGTRAHCNSNQNFSQITLLVRHCPLTRISLRDPLAYLERIRAIEGYC